MNQQPRSRDSFYMPTTSTNLNSSFTTLPMQTPKSKSQFSSSFGLKTPQVPPSMQLPAPNSTRRLSVRKANNNVVPSTPAVQAQKKTIAMFQDDVKRREEKFMSEIVRLKEENAKLRQELHEKSKHFYEETTTLQLQLDQQQASAKEESRSYLALIEDLKTENSDLKVQLQLLKQHTDADLSRIRKHNEELQRQLEAMNVHPFTLEQIKLPAQLEEEAKKRQHEFNERLRNMEQQLAQRKQFYCSQIQELQSFYEELEGATLDEMLIECS